MYGYSPFLPAFLHQNQHLIILLNCCESQIQNGNYLILNSNSFNQHKRHIMSVLQCLLWLISKWLFSQSLLWAFLSCKCSNSSMYSIHPILSRVCVDLCMCYTHRVHSVCAGGSPLPGCQTDRHEVWSLPEQTSQPWMFVNSGHLYTSTAQSAQSSTLIKALQ